MADRVEVLPDARAPGLATAGRREPVRLDIQLLRAVAVGVVVLYHCWPERFPGGFVGVDVFFVVSGLLITDHLVREADRTGRIRIARFWARRARRLLPLAFVVLLASAALALLVLPASQQRPSLMGVLWSSVYVQNWALASDATDYLARDRQPILTQHFWTLSVEEQFYLVWPVLLVVAMAIGARLLRRSPAPRRRAALAAILLVLVASLAHSIVLTATDPGMAYVATTTRAWEFAAGAALAFVPRDLAFLHRGRTAARIAASWLGYGTIAATTVLLPPSTPFPSATALLPVGAAVLCLLAGDVRRGDPTHLAGVRPVTWLGDVSYGLYLWHWPLLLAAPVLLGAPLTGWQKVVVIASAVALAGASKRAIEDPVRFAPGLSGPPARSLLIPVVGAAVIAAIVGGSLLAMQLRADAARAAVEAARETAAPSESSAAELPLVPPVGDRGSDYGEMYECFDLYHQGIESCAYGDDDAAVRLAIVGDSHASHLIPGLVAAAEDRGWSVTTFVGRSCDALTSQSCTGGPAVLDDLLAGDYDAVVTSSFRMSATPIDEVDAFWRALEDAGQRIVPIVDVPWHDEAAFACIDASGGDVAAATACASPRSSALERHPDRMRALAAARAIDVVDLTDAFCDDETCATVIDNTVVYQDSPSSHLTATMSRDLAERLGEALELRLAP